MCGVCTVNVRLGASAVEWSSEKMCCWRHSRSRHVTRVKGSTTQQRRRGHTVGRSTHRRVILQREAMPITAAASCEEALRTGHTRRVHEPAGVVCVCVSPSTMRGCLVRNGAVNPVNKTLNLKWVISSCLASSAQLRASEGMPWPKRHDLKDNLRQTLAISR